MLRPRLLEWSASQQHLRLLLILPQLIMRLQSQLLLLLLLHLHLLLHPQLLPLLPPQQLLLLFQLPSPLWQLLLPQQQRLNQPNPGGCMPRPQLLEWSASKQHLRLLLILP